MRGVQKVCSLIQLTTEYELDILSLFNIVPSDRNALGPAFLQSAYYIVEAFLTFILQPVTRGADNIIVISKFTVLSWISSVLETNRSHWGPSLVNTIGGRAVQNLHFGWQSVLVMMHEQCIVLMKQHTVLQFSSTLLFQCRSTFSNQISVVGSCNSSAMFQIVKQYNSFRIPSYGSHDFVGWCEHAKLSWRWRSDMFPGHTLCFAFRIKVVKSGLVYSYKSWNKVVWIFVEQNEKTCLSAIGFLNVG